MKTNKLLVPVITLGLLVMSCSKSSDGPAAVDKTSAKSSFSTVNSSLASDISSLNSAEGSVALNTLTGTALSGTGSPFSRISSFKHSEVKSQISACMVGIRRVLFAASGNSSAKIGDAAFVFADHKGVYNWNGEAYVKSDVASDIIEINYPKDANDTQNKAKFQLTAYTEKATPNGDQAYSPTLVKANVTISGTKEVDINITMGYGTDDKPNKGDISLYVNPYTETISFDDSAALAASASFSISKDGKNIIGVGGSFTFATTDDKEKFNPSTASMYVQLLNVRFTAANNPHPDPNDPNSAILITVTVDGGLAGQVVIVSEGNDDVPYIKYNDGTTERLDVVFADLKTQLDGFNVN